MHRRLSYYLQAIGVIVAMGILFGYTYFKTENLLGGPQIIIHSPEDGATVDQSLITINGLVKNASAITLNGRQIFTDELGNISEETLLSYGYNLMEIEAHDKFGKRVAKIIRLVYK